MEHPRWGMIQSVRLNRPEEIEAGTELFGYYGYAPFEFPEDFPWYFELKMQVERELRLEREALEKKVKLDGRGHTEL